jgi:hypothetical protein
MAALQKADQGGQEKRQALQQKFKHLDSFIRARAMAMTDLYQMMQICGELLAEPSIEVSLVCVFCLQCRRRLFDEAISWAP